MTTTMTCKVFFNAVDIREVAPGEHNVRIEADKKPVFMGTTEEAASYLEGVPVGTSVEVRIYRDGHHVASRSCMNKPALWPYVRDAI